MALNSGKRCQFVGFCLVTLIDARCGMNSTLQGGLDHANSMAAEIGFADAVARGEFRGWAVHQDFADFDHVGSMGNL